MNPVVSIITPSFNQGKHIEKTIRSVLSQEIEGLEYMVVDGGSTDDTVSILKRYEDRLVWVSEPDSGPAEAINKGFLHSTAPVVGWLNSDDVYYPGALRSVLDCFRNHPAADVVYGDACHIGEDDEVLGKYHTEEWNWERLKEVCFISQPAAFFRRRALERYGLLDAGVRCMDYEYWLRLGKEGARLVHYPRILAATRLHKDAFTVARRVACHGEINTVTRNHLGRTPDIWLFNYAHAVAESRGYSPNKPFRFALALSAVSVCSALRWNRRISMNMLVTVVGWLARSAVSALRAVSLGTNRVAGTPPEGPGGKQ